MAQIVKSRLLSEEQFADIGENLVEISSPFCSLHKKAFASVKVQALPDKKNESWMDTNPSFSGGFDFASNSKLRQNELNISSIVDSATKNINSENVIVLLNGRVVLSKGKHKWFFSLAKAQKTYLKVIQNYLFLI